MTNLEERVARLEARMDMDMEDREARRGELDATLNRLHRALDAQTAEMSKYKGFVGGVSLMISLTWAGVGFFKGSILRFLER